MNVKNVLENLENLIGKEFDDDEVICAFEDFEENGETEIIISESEGYTSNFEGYGKCTAWNAHINTEDSTDFIIWVSEDNIIARVA